MRLRVEVLLICWCQSEDRRVVIGERILIGNLISTDEIPEPKKEKVRRLHR